jgi:hypothetical protein
VLATLLFGGREIGHVSFGPPDDGGLRRGTLVPTLRYIAARPALRRVWDSMPAMQNLDGETIHHELRAQLADLTAAGLCLVDGDGVPLEPSFLLVVDLLSEEVDINVLLAAPLIQVAARFDTP